MKKVPLRHIRNEYVQSMLTEAGISSDPFLQSNLWLQHAVDAGVREPNAMVLATVSGEGMPSARVILLKELTDRGFVFFTNYGSRKGMHLALNPKASLLFFWEGLERQLRVEGTIEKLDPAESDTYFKERPLNSQISSIVSPQSQVVESREALIRLWDNAAQAIQEASVMRPDFWGGYILMPQLFEFWQGRENRLHDRLQYRLDQGDWIIERLAP